MPLFINEKEINWRETEYKISITVPLHPRIDTKPSTIITSKYLKVTSPPFIFECFLFDFVNPELSMVRIEEDKVTFELQKEKYGIWNRLSNCCADSKEYCKEQRETAFEENKQYLETVSKEKAKKKQEIHTSSVRKQMEVDDLRKKQIEEEKRLENERLIAELKRRKEQLKATKIAEKRKHFQKWSDSLPPTRQSGRITVTFTERVFPTAARESQEEEEKQWLEKQFAARKSLDLPFEQRNLEWLTSKAESLLKREDFRSAVNAYDMAVQTCPNLYNPYLGRSLAHLNLNNLHKAIEDSSKALELLVPTVTSNASARKEAHKIRGLAFQRLLLYLESLTELEAALSIDPGDGDLREDIENIRNLIEQRT